VSGGKSQSVPQQEKTAALLKRKKLFVKHQAEGMNKPEQVDIGHVGEYSSIDIQYSFKILWEQWFYPLFALLVGMIIGNS